MSKETGKKKPLNTFDIEDGDGGHAGKNNPYDKEPLIKQRNSTFNFLFNRYFRLEEEQEHKFGEMNDSKKNKKGEESKPSSATQHQPRASMAGKDHEAELWNFAINEANTTDRRMVRNKIRTTKYTWYTFVPKNLFEQFSKMANVYFLFIMVLQIIPPISITNG